MTARPILQWPDQRLRSVAQTVHEIDNGIRAIWDDMIDTMEAMPGVGLAAVQIGVMLRLAVVDCSQERGQALRMANPQLLRANAELTQTEEASPCLPGVSARISRPREIDIEYTNESGKLVEKRLTGLWAVSAQHQIDHLAGRMYFHRLSKLKREMLLKKATARTQTK